MTTKEAQEIGLVIEPGKCSVPYTQGTANLALLYYQCSGRAVVDPIFIDLIIKEQYANTDMFLDGDKLKAYCNGLQRYFNSMTAESLLAGNEHLWPSKETIEKNDIDPFVAYALDYRQSQIEMEELLIESILVKRTLALK